MDFIEFNSTKIVKVLSDGSQNTIRGTLDHNSIAASEGMAWVEFRTTMYMTALKNDVLLPLLGLAAVGQVFTLADALSPSKLVLTPNGGKEHTFDNAYPARWTVHGQKGTDPVRIDIDWHAMNWAEAAAGTYTHGTTVEGMPYAFTQGSMTLEGATRYFNQFRLGLDYGLITEHNNSIYPTNICPTDHNLTFGTSVLYSTCDSTTDLYTVPMTTATAATGSQLTLALSRVVGASTYGTSFVVGNVKLTPRFIDIRKHQFNRLAVFGKGFTVVGGAPLIAVTNDSTP